MGTTTTYLSRKTTITYYSYNNNNINNSNNTNNRIPRSIYFLLFELEGPNKSNFSQGFQGTSFFEAKKSIFTKRYILDTAAQFWVVLVKLKSISCRNLKPCWQNGQRQRASLLPQVNQLLSNMAGRLSYELIQNKSQAMTFKSLNGLSQTIRVILLLRSPSTHIPYEILTEIYDYP